MFTYLVKYTAPLVLFCALFLFSGVAISAVTLSGGVSVDLCCDAETKKQTPVDNSECADLECRCLTCSLSILHVNRYFILAPDGSSPLWQLGSALPSEHTLSIDYPPEFS